jgi:hypothetical protein
MPPKKLEYPLGDPPVCFGLTDVMSPGLEEQCQRGFLNQATPSCSFEGQRERDLLHRVEVRVCSIEVHLQSRP